MVATTTTSTPSVPAASSDVKLAGSAPSTIGPSMARVEAAHLRACIREAALATAVHTATSDHVVPLDMLLPALEKCGALLAMPSLPAEGYTWSSLHSALDEFRPAELAAPLAEEFPTPLSGSDAAFETFICDSCQRSRKVATHEANLEQLLSAPTWSCSHDSIQRIVARGGCEAADDELCDLLGDEFSATVCTIVGLPTAVDVARAQLPDEGNLMYTGPEGPFNESEGADGGIIPADYEAQLASIESLSSKLRSRVPPVEIVRLNESQVTAHAASVPQHSRLRVDQLQHRLLGHKLVYAAVMGIVAASRGISSKPHVDPGLLTGGLLSNIPVQHTLVARVQQDWEREKQDFEELLHHPLILGAALRLAEYWQSFCRAAVVEEFMAVTLATACDDVLDADSLQHALAKLEINAPADLLQYDATTLTNATIRLFNEEGDSMDEAALAPVIERLLHAAAELVDKTQWLRHVVSS
jgi:hypothetical protein